MNHKNRLVRPWLTWRRVTVVAFVLCLVAGGAWWWRRPTAVSGIPVADVTGGDFLDTLQLRGEIKPLKSIVLNAPVVQGDLRIIKLARSGSIVKRGDPVVQFDPTALQRTLQEKQSEVKRAESDIDRARAQARMQEEQNVTEQGRARNDVERARLDSTAATELLSPVEAQEKKLALNDAELRLRATDVKVAAGRDGDAADLESLKQKREKALAEVQQAQRNLEAMTLTAPADGMVTLMPNYSASSGMSSPPDFREGDRPWPGAAIAEIPSMANVFGSARVDEADRGRLRLGQRVSVRVDALPDKELTGSVTEISTLARAAFDSWPPVRNFDVSIGLEKGDPALRPGMSAMLRVVVDRVPGATLVPAPAVFTKGGRPVVYVLQGGTFSERAVEVARRSDERVAIARGVKPGERVALKDPTAREPEAGRK